MLAPLVNAPSVIQKCNCRNYSRARNAGGIKSSGTEIIDADRLIEVAAARGKSFGEAVTDGGREHGVLGVAVEPHIGDHAVGEIVEIREPPRVDVARDAVGGKTRLGGTRKRVRRRLSHRSFGVE